MNSRHFEWISSDGERIPNVLYRGDWVPGTVAAKYEAWYYTGGTWLSLVDNNIDEPMGNPRIGSSMLLRVKMAARGYVSRATHRQAAQHIRRGKQAGKPPLKSTCGKTTWK